MAERLSSGNISTKLERIAKLGLQRTRDLRSRMRELRTSGSVGALGEQSPGATRQLRIPLAQG